MFFYDITLDFSRALYQNNKYNGICMSQKAIAFNPVLYINRFTTCLTVSFYYSLHYGARLAKLVEKNTSNQ